ncbi:MAG: hypothetical protein IPF93_25570 [Saprospiraceae bacterium]|nr:hypothetical protein [Saprospiraceae bacterium]
MSAIFRIAQALKEVGVEVERKNHTAGRVKNLGTYELLMCFSTRKYLQPLHLM